MTEKDVDSVSHFSPAVAVATPPATVALLLLLSKGVLQELKSSLGCYSPSAREN